MKYLVLASGGLDSSVLLYKLVRENKPEDVIALNMYYGQKHSKEMEYFQWTVRHLGIKHITLDLAKIFMNDTNCTLLAGNGEIPEGEYKEQGEVPSTYVPFRNGLFLSTAASIAYQLGCDQIVYGAHMDDINRNAYPDCSAEFTHAMDAAIRQGTAKKVRIYAPYLVHQFTKKDVVNMGLVQGRMTHEEFEHTWSCYNGKDKPCCKCATCIDRKKAFEANDIFDID